jgi:hypothetical protein
MPRAMNAEEIRAIVRQEIVDALKSGKPRNRPKDNRPIITARLFPEEIAALDAAALARGLSRSQMIRACLQTVIPNGLRTRKEIPAPLQHAQNRRKARHHRDPATDDRAREQAQRRAVSLTIAAKQAQAEAREFHPPDMPAISPGMLSDAAGRRSVPKLSR